MNDKAGSLSLFLQSLFTLAVPSSSCWIGFGVELLRSRITLTTPVGGSVLLRAVYVWKLCKLLKYFAFELCEFNCLRNDFLFDRCDVV